MKKFFYLPIESKVRELDAKVLLALEAIENDYVVIIGSKILMKYLKFLPKGILFYKDSSNPMAEKFKTFKSYGHQIAVHDEEGFVQMNWDDYLTTRIKFDTLKYIDKFFCWGNKQFQAIYSVKNNINRNMNLVSVGHPRIDLLRYPLRNYNSNYKKKVKTILINTKLAEYNHNKGQEGWINIMKKHNMIQSQDFFKLKTDQVSYKKELMTRYLNLIKHISVNYHSIRIVLRPHPSENINRWKELTNDLKNVMVTNEKPIGYWIHKSDVVIHTGCTTALEAFIMDKPVITFKPINDKRFNVDLPDSISFKAKNEEDCIDIIKELLDGRYDHKLYKQKGNDILSKNIDSLEGEFAYKKIIKELNDLDIISYNFNLFLRYKIKSFFFLKRLRSIIVKFLKPSKRNYNRTFSKSEVLESSYNLQKILNNKINIKIDKILDNLYLLR